MYPQDTVLKEASPRRVLDLNGDEWWLGQAPPDALPDRATWDELDRVAEWLPATVPGNVRVDLARAGRLPDLSHGTNVRAAQWVDEHCWWLVRDLGQAASPGERAHLVLRGVDYIGDLFLNGQHLGRHEGMFSPQVHDVTGLLRAENRLAVRITGSRWLPEDRSSPWLQFLNAVESRAASISKHFPHRRDTLKCQMSFGWDFCPPLRTMGIWDDVYAVTSGDVFVRDVAAQAQLVEEGVRLGVEIELDAGTARAVQLRCILTGETFESEPIAVERTVDLDAGASHYVVELAVSNPRLWWPWDHGRPDLYRLIIQVWEGDRLHDSLALTTGLRQVEMDGWRVRVNGRRVYARGANWVPASILPGRVTEADYETLLSLARQANMNMLRVWGGGLREKRAFYDLCDRMGLLVWQEFPLACAFLSRFPRSPEYLQLVQTETRSIVRDLRNHPSVILWCGGNEFSPERNRALVETVQETVLQEDQSRPFLPASPAGGDSHNWQVWHNFRPPSAYRDDPAAFASEFGLQAPPDTATLRRFIPTEELWPPGPSWDYHGADLAKLRRYARPFLGGEDASLEAFVQASQQAQAHGLQIAVEHYRRSKARGGGGVLIWQLNEPWPAISWALVDYYRKPKPAYETVKRLLAPLLISVDYTPGRFRAGDDFRASVWIVNDGPEPQAACRVEVVLQDESGQPAHRFAQEVDMAADSAGIAGRLHWSLPPGSGWHLACTLVRDGEILAANEYDLGICDEIQPTPGQRLWAWLSSLVLPS